MCSLAGAKVEEEDAQQVFEMMGLRAEQAGLYDLAAAVFGKCGGDRLYIHARAHARTHTHTHKLTLTLSQSHTRCCCRGGWRVRRRQA